MNSLPAGFKAIAIGASGALGGAFAINAIGPALLVKHFAPLLARRQPRTVLVALHPGTVRSPLSAPILGATPATAPAVAVAQMLRVLDGLSPADSGGFFARDGSVIVW